jgi:hypothetical protein
LRLFSSLGTNVGAGLLLCNQRREIRVAEQTGEGGAETNQKWPEVLPDSPLGANDGRGKWASVAVIAGSVRSVTTPVSESDEQQASSHPTVKQSIAQHAARLFTNRNLLIEHRGATRVNLRVDDGKSSREKILRRKRSSRLVQHGRQLGRA